MTDDVDFSIKLEITPWKSVSVDKPRKIENIVVKLWILIDNKNYHNTPNYEKLIMKISLTTLLCQIQTAPLDASNTISK